MVNKAPSKGAERAFLKEMANTPYPYEVVKVIAKDSTITYTLPIGDGKSFKRILKSEILNKVKKGNETCVEPDFSAILMTSNNEGESSELINFEFLEQMVRVVVLALVLEHRLELVQGAV